MPQRMRYRWLVDRPRNVSRQDYERYQLLSFGAVGLGFLALGLLISSISGLTLSTTRELADIDSMTVEEALVYEGDSRDLVKIEGFLVAENPVTMPEEDGQPIIRGQLQLVARQPSRSGSADDAKESGDAETPEETADTANSSNAAVVPRQISLLEWEDTAESVVLSDGDRQIPLAFDLSTLPLAEAAGPVEPEYVRDGEVARTSRPVAVQYGDELLPLPPAYINRGGTVIVDVERAVLPQGASAVVVAGLAVTPTGNQLVDPLGDRLQVNLGTEADIREQGQRTRSLFFILAIPAGVASAFLG